MKVKQMTPVGNAYISYTQTSLKRNFCHKKFFLLANFFAPSFNRSHQEADICGEKNFFSLIHLTLNVFLISDFITCSQRSREKICDGTRILDGQILQSTAMLMSSTMSYWFNTILIYKFRRSFNPKIASSITEKVVLTITPLE